MNITKTKIEKEDDNLYELLDHLSDRRRGQGRRHELKFILILVIMSLMSGFDTLRAMGDFIKKNRSGIIKVFGPNKGRLPSHQTIGRALQNVDFNQLSEIFRVWALHSVTIADQEWISADGKAIAGTISNANNKFQEFTSTVSLFLSKQKQVIGCIKVNSKKDNEIPKFKELVKLLGLRGTVITADALHCQADTTTAIVESGNDYCIGVKKNQRNLLKQIKKKCDKRKTS